MKPSYREISTILASLRLYQDMIESTGVNSVNHMPHFIDAEPLDIGEVDSLCERLNSPPGGEIILDESPVETDPDAVIELAQEKFWQVVARHFPNIKTGDLQPWQAVRFDTAATEAVHSWININSSE